MSRETELAKNTFILTIWKISAQLVQFILLPLYTALLIPEEFGVVDLFNTYVTLLVPLFNWQLDRGLFRFLLDCRSNRSGQKKIFSTVTTANILQILIYFLFFFIAQNYIHSEYKVFLAIDVAANIILNTLLQFSRGIGRNRNYAAASFLAASSSVVLNVVFIAFLRMGALGMFLAVCISKFIAIAFLILTLRAWAYVSFKESSIALFKDISKYSLPLIPNALSWWVISASDRSVVSFVLGVAVNGIYSVANKFSAVLIAFYNVFDASWTEMASLHIADDDRIEFLSGITDRMFRLFSSVCLGIIAFMPFVFPILVNRQYSDAYDQIPILLTAVLFQVIVGLYSALYVALKKSVELAKTSIFAAAINFLVDILLISRLRLYAASVSTLAAFSSMALYRYFHIKKYIDIKLKTNTMISVCIVGAVTIISYYWGNALLQSVNLLLVIAYAAAGNHDLIKAIFTSLANRIKNI